MRSRKNTKRLLIVIVFMLFGISIAYAALYASLNVTVNKVTQNVLTWKVQFDTTGSPVSATAGGTSSTGRSCGQATVTANSVTVADTTLSKPGDSCRWTLTIKNTGTIDAKLTSITAGWPTSTTCDTTTGGKLVCGNIIYKLTTDTTGNTVLPTGGVLAKSSGTLTVYLHAIFDPDANSLPTSVITQTGAKFIIHYDQL